MQARPEGAGRVSIPDKEKSTRTLDRWVPIGLIVLLWAAHTVGVYLWLAANQFATGWDRPKHLVSTLLFDRMLHPINIVTLFEVFSLNIGYYPPLFPLSVVPLYRIFGVSPDVAGMVNVIYMLILLLSLYGIGARLYDTRTGLLAAFLGSMSPFLFSMAHYTYIDYALTAMITLAVYLLLCTGRFRHTACSILFGVALGLAMLYKWTPILFVSGPLLLVLAGMVKDGLDRVRRGGGILPPKFLPWRELIIAVAAGLLLTWLWHAPNANLAATLFLGNWLPVLSVLLIGGAAFAVLLPGYPWFNLLKSLALAALITSFWYLPRADMFRDIVSIVAGGRADRPNYLSLSAYLYYPSRLIGEGLGWLLFALAAILLVAACYESLARAFNNDSGDKAKGLPDDEILRSAQNDTGGGAQQSGNSCSPVSISGFTTVGASDLFVLLWFVVPFIVATFSTHREVRSVLPLMSPIVIALARLLLGISHPILRRATIGLIGLYLIVQFAVLNVTALAGVAEATQIKVPLLGRVGLFAQGEHIAWANHDEHDDRYWIVPDVLQTVSSDFRTGWVSTPDEGDVSPPNGYQGVRQDAVVLGLLLNSRAVNEYNIDYLVRTGYPEVVLSNLCQNRDLYPGYARLFGCDYLLMRDRPDSSEPADLVQTLVTAPPAFFADNFSLVRTYLWPNGEKVYLFKNQTHTIPDHFGAEWLSPPIEHAVEMDLGDTMRLLGYNVDTASVPSQGRLLVTLYWMGLNPTEEDYSMHLKLLNGVHHVWGEQQGRPRWDASLTSKWTKGEVVEDIREIPVWPGTPPGSYTMEVLVSGIHSGAPLEPASGADVILGPVDLPAGPVPGVDALDVDRTLNAVFGNRVKLLGYKQESGLKRGDGIHLTLYWQALEPMDKDYVVFNHLTGADGTAYAQKDNPPVDGYYPTSRWTAGEVVRDRYDLFIPADAPLQAYVIETGLYLPDAGQRLAVTDETGQITGDKVILSRFEIADR